ncbi:Cell division protein FtsY homolog [Achromobacter xylosoxidans]|jgi:fused signal recognition particle receptor|uniref:Signal recognition particle receptor FtsY n=1 Tax=Alcaligenes xylosoxydans xylosoxydans TaxID=85698 RepID=A0A9W5A9F7_ALCXX|nr:signal recognition particle-docking protein FtsY [Achromobacter xylosoxidans]MBK1982260.1 signal recognition particle-docking protein FtsY [Achromobacter xylosoxidans]MCH4576315.1 signal recognition particle-docking protein FtsY [Achromobacter xylosoxidans]MCZ8401956.1 signal recognition particle-docking protein FtsY [Achromobacter xylosoxidans]MDD7988047.1 signal recognition particle-docking protein FtsY [Achromobacter xylosoxidans]MDH0518755.1 signal recognition particle-docking protein F
MFSRFFKKKSPPPAAPAQPAPPPEQVDAGIAPQAEAEVPAQPVEPAVPAREFAPVATPEVTLPVPSAEVPAPASASVPQPSPAVVPQPQASAPVSAPAAPATPSAAAPAVGAPPVASAQVAAAPVPQQPVAPAPAVSQPAATPSAPVVAPAPAAIVPAPAAPEPEAAPKKASWLSRLKQGLSRTGQSIGGIFVGVKVDENLFEELESALIMADAGLEATEKLLTALRARVKKERIEDPAKVKAALRQLLADHLRPLERAFDLKRAQPLVVMIAGVNGAGKTTSIGKLAHTFQRQGASVLLAAGDTFRAAAREQLIEWGSRNNVTVISQDGGDPAAVAFDSVNAGRARGMGVVMVDTAGRLPTQLHLMEELKKIRRVIGKADPAAPHEVLLVVDGNTGQNALAQIRAFDAAINLTGLVVTKLDGTAKGGTLAAVAAGSQGVRPIPVYWIGVGESLEDLQPFVADEFAGALLAD